MERYKFNEHFRGIGQDEYLSQGKYNYGSNIDMNLQNAYFKLGNLPVIHGKCVEDIRKIVTLGTSQYALGDIKVWYIGSSQSPTVDYNPEVDAPFLTSVFEPDFRTIDIIPMIKNGSAGYYLFHSNRVRWMDYTEVSGDNTWTASILYTDLSFTQSIFINYLNARLYFAQWDGGKNFKLSKIDEFGVKTDNIFGERYFSSKIIGLTITGSVLNIYLENGEKSMMDLTSETIIETVNINKTIRAVVGHNNKDYLLCESDYKLGIAISAGYEVQDILKNSVCSVLGKYGEYGTSSKSSLKNNPRNNKELFKIHKGIVYFSDERTGSGHTIQKMNQDFSIHSVCSTDIVGDLFTNSFSALELYDTRAFFSYGKIGSSNTFIASVPFIPGSGYYQKRGYLVENVFTGGDITRKKELVEFRLRADIPEGTRVVVKALCDGVLSDESVEITANSEKLHKNPFTVSGYEIMFVYEIYNDLPLSLAGDTPNIYEMEIAYNIIQN